MYFCWLRWTSPEIARDDVAEDDFPVCGRRIIDVKLVAERLGRGCYGCGEKLHLCDILLENRSGLASTFSIICKSCGVVNSVQTSKTVPGRNGKRRTFSINTKAALGEMHIYLFCTFSPMFVKYDICIWKLSNSFH